MKKIALVFAVAVLAPSLVLAWLAIRSLRHQQFVLERQQSLLCQGFSDSLARSVQDALAEQQRVFNRILAELLAKREPAQAAVSFDESIRQRWNLAEVGFVVTLSGDILSPSDTRPEARRFLAGNGLFLANRESAEVYLNAGVYTGTPAYAQALAAAQTVITSGGYTLDPNFRHMFQADNNTSPEIIFAITQDGQKTLQQGGWKIEYQAYEGERPARPDRGRSTGGPGGVAPPAERRGLSAGNGGVARRRGRAAHVAALRRSPNGSELRTRHNVRA